MNNTTTPAGMGFREFVGLVAALMATNALAIDTMLPALGQIGTALGLTHANDRQWVISAYLIGFGIAQIIYGPLADRYGRKAVLVPALVIYVVFSLLIALSRSFELMLAARFIQGIGAAGTRVLSVTIVRDRFEGRLMARVMSLAVIVFLGVPILAPSLGQLVMLAFPWPAIFIGLALFGSFVLAWIVIRLPETLRPADRRAIEFGPVLAATRLTLGNRASLFYTLASTLMSGSLFGFINSSQQLFTTVLHEARFFTLIFAIAAAFIALASLLNARLVERLGMRMLSHTALLGYIACATLHAAIALAGYETVWTFTIMQSAMMFCFGLLVGNFGAMAMEPLGHIAGTASSVQGFISLVGAALIGFFIGQSFDGTAVPMTLGFAGCSLLALACVLAAEGGSLFRSPRAVA